MKYLVLHLTTRWEFIVFFPFTIMTIIKKKEKGIKLIFWKLNIINVDIMDCFKVETDLLNLLDDDKKGCCIKTFTPDIVYVDIQMGTILP